NEAKVYEFIVRHFLACLSKNAEGQETIVEINIAGEKFIANGLQIIAKNYLDIYIYEKWSDKEIHTYQERQTFQPTSIDMVQEETSPPKLLTEADLIALMDKHGIGTDATHAEHIETIKSRQYVGLKNDKYFMPSKLGIGLVMGYDNMGFSMSKPNLRADLEKDLKLICDGQKDPKLVLQDQITKYRDVFKLAMERANLIDNAIAEYLEEQPLQLTQNEVINTITDIVVFKCPKCGSDMILKNRKQGTGKYITCVRFPACNNSIWFPQSVEDITVLEDTCTKCPGNMHKMTFKLTRNMIHFFESTYTTCIGGCDPNFNETMDIKDDTVKKRTLINDSGYETMSNRSVPETSSRIQMRNNTGEFISNSRTNTQRNNVPPRNENYERNPSTNNRKKGNTGSTKMKDNTNNLNLSIGLNNNNTNTNNIKVWGNIDNDAEIMCQCNQLAIQLTVRKDGPNQGRQFYKCAKHHGSGCDFFLWASDRPQEENTINHNNYNNQNSNHSWSAQYQTQQPSTSGNSTNWRNTSVSESNNVIMCTCNEPARQFTVQKEGPNKGRLFYNCPKGRDSTCRFFKWADVDESVNTNERTNWGNYGNFNNNTTHRGKSSASKKSQETRAKRKCGICGIEGHTRKTCPENVMDKK
ncbi:hypothetical protein M0802_003432, partial [Mischocyttarus mexicanus]